jgi:6-phosphogluconolactonase
VVERLSREVRVLPDPAAVAQAVVGRLEQLAKTAGRERGRFTLAVSGGHTPEPMFRALAGQMGVGRRWDDWQLFWCDERLVPTDDSRSNFGLARRLWLVPAGFPPSNAHPVDTALPEEEAAGRYDALLRELLDPGGGTTFDAVVLGVGPDGHTASLFPAAATLEVADRWVVADGHPAQPPWVPRVTLTLEALGRARVAIFVACGEGKRRPLSEILAPSPGRAGRSTLPAGRVTARDSVEWYLDRAAAPFP